MLLDGLGKRCGLHACTAGFQRVLKVHLRIKNRFKINPSLRGIRAVRLAGGGGARRDQGVSKRLYVIVWRVLHCVVRACCVACT